MPFFKLKEMPEPAISPGHSTAYDPTITGKELEIGYYTEPKGTGAKPHHHPSEQIIMVLSGRLRMRIGDEVRDIGPGEVALIMGTRSTSRWRSKTAPVLSASRPPSAHSPSTSSAIYLKLH